VISDVADFIGQKLGEAKNAIAAGRKEISDFVAKQPKDLQKVAGDAAKQIGSEFDQLETDVADKQQSLVDDLASKYVEARNAVDEEIAAAQAENKGLWDKAKEAVGGAIETIIKLKDMLLGVLARAAGAVEKIIKDPVTFLGNFVNAVKGGILKFADNIVTHLKKGLQEFLFGALAGAGIEIPETFDLKGIIKLILSILGLTWTNIRTKFVKRIGEKAMAAVEQGVEIFKILATEGIGGILKFLLDKLGDLKDKVMSAIQDFVVVKVIKAGITWLISLLNPAAAFIKACKLIYDVVMFFVEKGSEIKEFVDTVLDSVESIASGALGKVADMVEGALAKVLPLLINLLASVLGLGGISEKIKEILEKVQKPVSKAIDKVLDGAMKLAGPIIRAAKGLFAKGKAKLQGGDDTPEGKRQRLDKGMAAGLALMNRFAGRKVGDAVLKPGLAAIRLRYGMTALEPKATGARWSLQGAVNPTDEKTSEAATPAADERAPTEPGLVPPVGAVTGALPLYRGIHFESTMTEDEYKQVLAKKYKGETQFSEAVRSLADSKRPDGSDVPKERLDAAMSVIEAALAKEMRSPPASPSWTVSKAARKEFDNRFLALLHLYVNDLAKFKDVMKVGGKEAVRLGFAKSPFISTTKSAVHAARYALGQKATKPEAMRTEGVVGKIFIYLFKLADLPKAQAVDPVKLANEAKIGIGRKIHEGEVTFVGAVPGENLEADMEVHGFREEAAIAKRAAEIAGQKAGAHGGLVKWDS
jgi:hypothetical protein